jgi:cysteine dioxygenase
MEKLINCLTKLSAATPAPEKVLAEIQKTGLNRASCEKYLFFEDAAYTRNLVFKNESFEALLLCWKPGQTTMIHDHAAQGCWMTVLQGVITSENFKYVAPAHFKGELEKLPTQSFKTNQCYYIDDDISLHLLKNPAKSAEETITLHVYSKPFSSCTVYDLEKKETRELPLAYQSMGGNRGTWQARDIARFPEKK